MNYILIVNSLAGKGVGQIKFENIKEKTAKLGVVKSYLSSSLLESKGVIAKNRDWLDAVIFAGGDGTFREGVKVLSELNLDVPLGFLPMGSGNDFVRSLGIPSNLERAIDLISKKHMRQVYNCKLNDTFFINVASVGLDAAIVERQKKIKKRIAGPLSYVISVFIEIFSFKNKKYNLIIDGLDKGGDYMLIAIANGKYYGGGMKIAPDASPYKSDFQVLALKQIPRILTLFIFPMIYFGWHPSLWCVESWCGKSVEIRVDQMVPINLDGDTENGDTITIQKNELYRPKIYLSDSQDS